MKERKNKSLLLHPNQLPYLAQLTSQQRTSYETLNIKADSVDGKVLDALNWYYAKVEEYGVLLIKDKISIKDFQMAFIEEIKDCLAFVLFVNNENPSLFYEEMMFQLPYILKFGLDIETERTPRNNALLYRASLYIFSAWVFYQKLRQEKAKKTGYTKERIEGQDWKPIKTHKRINEEFVGEKKYLRYEFN